MSWKQDVDAAYKDGNVTPETFRELANALEREAVNLRKLATANTRVQMIANESGTTCRVSSGNPRFNLGQFPTMADLLHALDGALRHHEEG